jgi:hypothetical protein
MNFDQTVSDIEVDYDKMERDSRRTGGLSIKRRLHRHEDLSENVVKTDENRCVSMMNLTSLVSVTLWEGFI